MGFTSLLLLSSLGLAITAQAQNCSKPVPGPNMNLKGNDILLETFPNGTSVSFVCGVGYITAGGSPVITCTSGNWSPVRLKCKRRNCGSFGDILNGNIEYEGTDFGDKLTIQCNTGYRLVGSNQIFCGDSGWMGRMPTCEVTACLPPPMIANGGYSPKKEEYYEYGEVVQYACQQDYTLKGSKSSTCSEEGKFSPDPPTCIEVICSDPDIINADWTGGSRPPYRHTSTVTYTCRSGYTMVGRGTLVCDINSKWSPGLPTCEKIQATTKATTTTTTTTTTPTAAPNPSDTPDSGNNLPQTLGIVLGGNPRYCRPLFGSLLLWSTRMHQEKTRPSEKLSWQ
ncbi:membrane cofactor protein-like isoform X16 [Toxotes jaculatrix]|uniref:membrane cofactor protein-like isoform X16 n=1 Tax=Toxotes jaculatrix TaxID=941984 RepID=UPI001B3AAB55|nr:membrane cofactor protein-like isoform X16 [Toxotes jaculatrix]